jgi:O-antigen/teichoic acid export membrane protein
MSSPATAVRDAGGAHLLHGAYSLLANTGLSAILGMAFWVLAARVYPTAQVGRDTVLIAVMLELSTICQLNLGNAIVRFLPDLGAGSARALAGAYALSASAALALGGAFVVAVPHLTAGLGDLRHSAPLAVGFVLALTLWGIFTLQDQALTATRRAHWIPVENVGFGAMKLAALAVLAGSGLRHALFLAWTAPMLLLLAPVNALLFSRAIPERAGELHGEATLTRIGARSAASFLGADYLASVLTQATLTIMPLVVLSTLGARQAAYFAMPFTIVLAFDTFAYGACSSLVVEGSLAPQRLGSLSRLFLARVLAPVIPLAALLAIGAPLVLLPFGSAYAVHGAGLLALMMLGSVFRAILALFSAIARVQRRGLLLAAIELALLLLVLGPSLALAGSYGIDGVGASWLAANAVVCVAILPTLVRFLRSGASGPARHAPSRR